MKKIFCLIFILVLSFSCTKSEEKKVETTTTKTEAKVSTSSKREYKALSPKDLEAILSANKDKVVLVNFFATWCPPCRKEVPELVELYKTYKGKNVEFIGISVDENGAEAVDLFAEKININYPLYLSSAALNNAYKIDAIPTTLLYDKKGKLVQTLNGYVEGTELAKMLDMMLK